MGSEHTWGRVREPLKEDPPATILIHLGRPWTTERRLERREWAEGRAISPFRPNRKIDSQQKIKERKITDRRLVLSAETGESAQERSQPGAPPCRRMEEI